MHRTNTPSDVANTGVVKIDAGEGVQAEMPVSLVPNLAARLAAFEYSSGLRNLSELIPSRTAGAMYAYRTGPTVTLIMFGLVLSQGGAVLTLPSGYRPPYTLPWNNDPGFALSTRILIAASGSFSTFGSALVDKPLYGTVSYGTTNAVPTVEPGTPA